MGHYVGKLSCMCVVSYKCYTTSHKPTMTWHEQWSPGPSLLSLYATLSDFPLFLLSQLQQPLEVTSVQLKDWLREHKQHIQAHFWRWCVQLFIVLVPSVVIHVEAKLQCGFVLLIVLSGSLSYFGADSIEIFSFWRVLMLQSNHGTFDITSRLGLYMQDYRTSLEYLP